LREEGEDEESSSASSVEDIEGAKEEVSLPAQVQRLAGMGVFLSPNHIDTPTVFQLFVSKIHGVPETIVFLTLETVGIPTVPAEYRIEIVKYGSGIYRVIARFGYAESTIKIAKVMEDAFQDGLPRSEDYTIFFNKEHISIRRRNLFLRVVLYIYSFFKKLFSGMGNFQLPASNVMAVGVQVDL